MENTIVIILIVSAIFVAGFVYWIKKQGKSKGTGAATKSPATKSGGSKSKKTTKRK